MAPFVPLPDFYFSPLKVAEYMAAGVCPVASDLGGLGELLQDHERAISVRRRPRRARLEELGAGEAENEDRRRRAERDEVLEQVDEHRLRPVDVLDDRY